MDPAAEAAICAGNNVLTADDRRVPQNAVGDVADDAWPSASCLPAGGSPLIEAYLSRYRRAGTAVSGTEEMIDWTWQVAGLLGEG